MINILEIHGTSAKFGGASNGTKILFESFNKSKKFKPYICFSVKNLILSTIKVDRSRILNINFSTRNPIGFLINIFRLVYFIKTNNISIIHTHHRNDTIYSCLSKPFIRGIKIIYTVHGVQIKNPEKSFFYNILNFLFLKLTNQFVDQIAYISDFTKNGTQNLFEKIRLQEVILNGTPRPRVTNKKEGVLKELGLDCNKFIISLIGGVSGYKRPRLVLEIAKYLTEYTDIIFLIIGDGDEIPSLKNEIRKAKLPNIRFVKSTLNIGDLINLSDIIISVAKDESFGRTLIEGMALKKPVISFSSGGPIEIIENNHNGYLVEDLDCKLFASCITKLYENKDLYIRFSNNSYNRYLDLFSSEIYCSKYMENFEFIYEK